MMLSKKTILVLAIALAAATRVNGQDDQVDNVIRVQARVIPAVHVGGTWMQVENVSAGEQVKDELFNGTERFAQGASSVTEINLDPSTMSMLGDRHGRDADLARKLNLMVVRSYSYSKPGMYNAGDVEALRKRLENGSWSCPIHVSNENGSSDICSRAGADHETNEMVILSVHPQKLTFIHIAGKMSLGELDEMTGARGMMPRVIVIPRPVPEPHIHIKIQKDGPRAPESSQPVQPSQPPQPPQPAQPPQ